MFQCHADLEVQRCLPFANKTAKNSHETTILRGSQPASILVPEKKGVVVEEEGEGDHRAGNLGIIGNPFIDLSDQNFHCNKRNSTVLEPYTFDRIFRLLTLVINELTFKFISALCLYTYYFLM